jgi:hypothetical protein
LYINILKNSLLEEQAIACENEKTNLGRDEVLRMMYQWLGK